MTKTPTVLLVDDEPLIRIALSDSMRAAGFDVRVAATGEEALEHLDHEFDVVVIDLKLPDISGIEILRAYRERWPRTDMVMITAHGSIPSAVEAMKLGARDFLTKPFETAELLEIVHRYVRVRQARQAPDASGPSGPVCCGMVGRSAPMLELFRVVRAVAESSATVLIQGETGTGKELVAGAIHQCSRRSQGPLVKVNCASLPESLVESELYGTERGAFTGAHQRRRGRFEQADRGTLFLDEIDEMPIGVQAKLLRSIQEKEIDRLGATGPVAVDVRLLAATKVDLRQRVASERFREDLYHRLNVLPVTLPPLRDRGGDIQLLADHFLARSLAGRSPKHLTEAARAALAAYGWPGNVRELANVIERAATLSGADTIDVTHLGLPVTDAAVRAERPLSLSQSLQEEEERRIDEALARTGGRKAEAAELLGISRKTLWEKLKRRDG